MKQQCAPPLPLTVYEIHLILSSRELFIRQYLPPEPQYSLLDVFPFQFRTLSCLYRASNYPATTKMDTAIDLSDASKALDLSNIRFQLM